MNHYILDASFLVVALLKNNPKVTEKWNIASNEVKNEKAILHSVSFFLSETANALRYTLEKEKAIVYLSLITNLPINYYNLQPEDWTVILDWSYTHNTTVYDTSYHYIASLLKGTFLTCDSKYYQKAQKEGFIELIK
ncbi:hypothetical protein CO051_03680 [Candidatus Roizmanbacteria bacterium CG_4_9_14_0_2_um_filter_39_13]|uniref:PIN domain-containing protein n=1 Tax=Candidatus Roizmanbacteria bacterium CG_4_9_14_0_2_um_filter_39_13 TaxID=1974839 RepID=A0A2M8EYW5_9BACT|nr:MAG: hypothetical protein CO051_03680 [Candidatus Roizmanbacteria bacterium CG_4_9_14_0_2_um_filter_39_13]